jgi:Protein of unknown function (DUF1236)
MKLKTLLVTTSVAAVTAFAAASPTLAQDKGATPSPPRDQHESGATGDRGAVPRHGKRDVPTGKDGSKGFNKERAASGQPNDDTGKPKRRRTDTSDHSDQPKKDAREPRRDQRDSSEVRESNRRNVDDGKRALVRKRIDRSALKRSKRDVHVEFRVGVSLPHSVTLYAVPGFIVDVYPSYRYYRYYYDGDIIVIVDPNSYRVVDIIHL